MWELDLECKGVESLSGEVSELQFIGVVIKFEYLEDLGNDIEIFALLGSGLQLGDSAVYVVEDVGGSEELVGPHLQGGLDSGILSLLSVFLAGVGIWGITTGLTEWGHLV